MQADPSGAALLDQARRALTEAVVPGPAGRPPYVALTVAHAIGLAARALPPSQPLKAAGARARGRPSRRRKRRDGKARRGGWMFHVLYRSGFGRELRVMPNR